MKLSKVKSRSYKGKDYYKYRINIPEVKLVGSGIKAGDELEIKSELGRIILEKRKTNENEQK